MILSIKRNALLRHRVPFVIPGRQFFLPPLFELRERELRGIAAGERLHFPAQAVLLRELVAGDVASQSLKDLGALLGFSAMSMTTAANELKAQGLAEISEGMPRHVVFPSAVFNTETQRHRGLHGYDDKSQNLVFTHLVKWMFEK